jgi:3-deoxy-D-arabino-heptulosonate 7-phosphate (DAHP) synthase
MKAKLEISPLTQWLKGEKPYIIAGPCSIESEEQITRTAVQLKGKGSRSICNRQRERRGPIARRTFDQLVLKQLNKTINCVACSFYPFMAMNFK